MESVAPLSPNSGVRTGHLVILSLLLGFGLSVVGVTGYFRLSSDSNALRCSLMESSPGQWHKKIAVHIGGLTMGVLRTGLRWVKLPAESRAAIETLRGAEVGIYKLQTDPAWLDQEKIVATADKTMRSRGWDRVVGVVKEGDLVLAYIPRRGLSVGSTRCCLAVLHGETLVVGSARGNLQPLMELAWNRLDCAVFKSNRAL